MISQLLLFLQSVFLQTATGNPFVDFWQRIINPSQPTGQAGAIIITPDYVPLASAILMLIVFFIIYTYASNVVPKDKKHLWAAVLFLAHIFAFPIFWYHYIWKSTSE